MIALLPNPTGTGHNMRMFAIAKELRQKTDEEIVLFLSSMQHIFTSMFEEIDVEVVNFTPNEITDFSKKSNLSKELHWETMVGKYFTSNFFNGNKILKYMNLLSQYKPSLVVSDYNINATMAAGHLNIKNIFVTERYNFTLVDVSNEQLEKGGFSVNRNELNEARIVLNQLFNSLCSKVDLILTDKPYVESMDKGSFMEKYLEEGKALFVGPMIRELPTYDTNIRKEMGLEDGKIIVATVSGTTMFTENKDLLLNSYIQMYSELRKQHSDLEMVLLGRSEVDVPDGVHSIPYLPNWIPLLQEASLLFAHPGWITATEIASLKVPTVFCLSSYSEYHEVEAYERLKNLNFATNYGGNVDDLIQTAEPLLSDPSAVEALLDNYTSLAYDNQGSKRAAKHILSLLNSPSNKAIEI